MRASGPTYDILMSYRDNVQWNHIIIHFQSIRTHQSHHVGLTKHLLLSDYITINYVNICTIELHGHEVLEDRYSHGLSGYLSQSIVTTNYQNIRTDHLLSAHFFQWSDGLAQSIISSNSTSFSKERLEHIHTLIWKVMISYQYWVRPHYFQQWVVVSDASFYCRHVAPSATPSHNSTNKASYLELFTSITMPSGHDRKQATGRSWPWELRARGPPTTLINDIRSPDLLLIFLGYVRARFTD